MKRLPTRKSPLLVSLSTALLLLVGTTSAQAGSGSGRVEGSSTSFGTASAQTCYLQTKHDIQRTGAALDICTRALSERGLSRKDRAHTLVNRATNLNSLRRFEAAMADVESALRLEPRLAEAFVTRGNALLMQGAPDKALEEYDRALTLELRERHAGLVNRALTYQALNKHEDAYRDFRAAAEIVPDWVLPREFIERYQEQFGYQ